MNTTSDLLIRDLGDGLILRRGSLADADALADIDGPMHSDNGPDQPEMGIDAWIRDLVAGLIPQRVLLILRWWKKPPPDASFLLYA